MSSSSSSGSGSGSGSGGGGGGDGGGGSELLEKKPHVTWDEETIERHNLDRGTRMKIDEPNTPFHYYAAADDDALGDSSFALNEDHQGDKEPVSPARSLSGKERDPSARGSTGGSAPPVLQWEELQSKLERVQQHEASQSPSQQRQDDEAHQWDSSDDPDAQVSTVFAERDEEGHKVVKDPKFAEKRKHHYNEFMMLKAWKQAHLQQDKDDDEDEDKGDDDQETNANANANANATCPPAPISCTSPGAGVGAGKW